MRGVIDEADVRADMVEFIAPVGFQEHAVAENAYAGNAMNRSTFYQYGTLPQRDPSDTSTRPSARLWRLERRD